MKKNGFTLIELLIAIVVGLVIMAAVYGVMTMAQRTSAGTGRKVLTQQDTRSVLDFMASEIRMASYNPSMSTTTWTNATTIANVNACANVTAVIGTVTPTQGNRGILFANANNLFIAMDINRPSDPPNGIISDYGKIGDYSDELIFYSYNVGTRAITRSISCGQNETILGGTVSGTRVYNDDMNPKVPLFQYFDWDGTPLTLPINIPAIRRIRINIAAETENPEPSSNQRKRMIYSTDIIVRNHAVFLPNPN